VAGALIDIAGDAYVAPGARLIGQVRMASESSVYHGSVVNGEAAPIEVGPQANIQDNCVVESRPGQPVRIGARVSLGHNARVYGAIIEDASLIAIGATVLPGAYVATNSIVAANATVPEGMHVPPRTLIIGQGRNLRAVTEAEIARIERGAREYARLCREYLSGSA
jgi:carbonic anhydrase/acetyltransferase-like protein (isoleucine patch superfamily)